MIIDFHTHIFPDQIAENTISKMEKIADINAYTRGTLEELKLSMRKNAIDISVILPVATKPSQFDTINHYASEINGKDGIISFGGIHPDSENYKEELKKIKSLGLPGIKLHPDYQRTFIDDPKMLRIIQYAVELGLIVSIHAGLDIGLPDPIHCPPERSAHMLQQIDNVEAKIILAHTGGYDQWDAVEEYLVGKNVWFDTAYCLGRINSDQFTRIVTKHGADRILFGTDSPWGGQKEDIKYLHTLDLTEEELEQITWKNGAKLLGIF
jgi:predicted TIM-barrel fold metal-dependent hydrolase